MARTKQGPRKAVSQFNNRAWNANPATGREDSSTRRQHDKAGQACEQGAEDQRVPETVAEALEQALKSAPPPGDFATGGQLDFVLPGLEVLDSSSGSWEPVGLPLSEAAAEALASKLELVPFGGGAAAASEAEASQAWQLDAARFRLSNPRWQEAVDTAIKECCGELGVGDVDVDAQPHKLLLFADGSQPSAPYDAAQAEGGWGTLVVHLPTAYEGGQLVVSHGGRTKTFDFSADSAHRMHYAAFYADCNHEVKPVTRGRHVALVYGLTCSGQRPCPADRSTAAAAVRAVVQRWEEEWQADASKTPAKLVYLLERKYSQDALRGGLAALKGADRSRGQVLAALQEEGLLEVHLALARREDWGRLAWLTVQHFVGLDGRPAPHWGTMELDTLSELCQCDGLDDLEPDSESEQEGSDCSDEERSDYSDEERSDYSDEEPGDHKPVSMSALVVWPKSRLWDMLGKGGLKPAADGLLHAAQQGSVPAADQREWAAALLRALPLTAEADAVAAVLAAVAELRDAPLSEQCLTALSAAGSQHQRFGGKRIAAAAIACIPAEHAPAVARLCRLCGWSAPCVSAVEALLEHLAAAGVRGLPSCIALLRELHTAATAPEGAAHATAAVASVAPAAAAAAAAEGPAPATALSQPADSASCGRAAVVALLKSSLAHLSSTLAKVQRADKCVYASERARQAEAASGMVQLLSLVQEWSDEAALERFLLTGFARHFIAAGSAADGDCAGGQAPMLAALMAACQRFGWGSSRTAAILTAAAAGCAPSTGRFGDFLELAKGVQAAAGQAAAALVPQLTAAFLKALPPAQPSVYAYPETTELDLWAQDLLDWVAEHGSREQFVTLFEHAVTCKLGLQAVVDVALRVGRAKSWWAQLQPGLLEAFGRRGSTPALAVLQQLQRVRQASGVDSGTAAASAGDGAAPASADAAQRYMQLAAAVVDTLEPLPAVRGGRPSTPSAAADFVRELLLAVHVPDCSESDQLSARAAAHVSSNPLRYPLDTVLLPALEGMAQQLQLDSLAAAVRAVPGLQAAVQHVVGALPQPPAMPEDWSRPAAAQLMQCAKRNCVDCPAVRAFLEDARESERRFEMKGKRLGHFVSTANTVAHKMRRQGGTPPGFTWKQDGTAIVCSKHGSEQPEMAELYRKHSAWRQLQAALGGEGAPPSGGGGGAGAVQQQQQQQQQRNGGDASDPADGGPPAKRQRL